MGQWQKADLRILRRDAKNPDDVSKWNVQHNALKDFGPPYVYHVVSLRVSIQPYRILFAVEGGQGGVETGYPECDLHAI